MVIRLGYACISNTLEGITTSTNYTYTAYSKEKNNAKLDEIIKSNLTALEQIIDYNIANNIHFYRLSSRIIPLATKKEVVFDYLTKYDNYYDKIASKIKKSQMRIDFHPDQFCVLNSTNQEVVLNSIEILKYHYNLLKKLKVATKILVLHVGSNAFGKKNSLSRFINNYQKLPTYIKKAIAVENDDKVFNIDDCLYLNQKLGIPVILDYHHYVCNSGDINLDDKLEKIFNTWHDINPKIHFSSPKNLTKKEMRSHSDYIDCNKFIEFIEKIKKYKIDIDIMIEAKKKDEALFRLVRELKYKTNYHFIDDTSFEP